MADTTYKKKALYSLSNITAPASGTKKLNITNVKSAAKGLKLVQEVLKNGASEYTYNVKSLINVKIYYNNGTLENYAVYLNKDRKAKDENNFINESYLNIKGIDISSIEVLIINNSTEPLNIATLSIYESNDIEDTTFKNTQDGVADASQHIEYIGYGLNKVVFKPDNEEEYTFIIECDENGLPISYQLNDGYITRIMQL